ncbi:metal ABC transporter, nickel uptake transporter family, permease protein CbiQ [Bifidobacterium saguini DSM 23967]|uniref:Metal ABC transporter, nickel uptake transporter family, permease protein CbiQ n=2 Tax=Bifidobacterium saguini TaxID=762210 RepID=A0A087DC22_9BIFI|nr:metal ABC transporter, nickel uptake transporter family, permease protein CbiQ [Bifidobacterium saguini DSM 23967]
MPTILQILLSEVILIGISVFLLWKPELVWKLEHFLDVKGGEPTDFYTGNVRLLGTLMLVGAIVLPFILLAITD